MIVQDEIAFMAQLGPELTLKVDRVARAMCKRTLVLDGEPPCDCEEPNTASCIAFGLYGHLAHAAVLAMEPTPQESTP